MNAKRARGWGRQAGDLSLIGGLGTELIGEEQCQDTFLSVIGLRSAEIPRRTNEIHSCDGQILLQTVWWSRLLQLRMQSLQGKRKGEDGQLHEYWRRRWRFFRIRLSAL